MTFEKVILRYVLDSGRKMKIKAAIIIGCLLATSTHLNAQEMNEPPTENQALTKNSIDGTTHDIVNESMSEAPLASNVMASPDEATDAPKKPQPFAWTTQAKAQHLEMWSKSTETIRKASSRANMILGFSMVGGGTALLLIPNAPSTSRIDQQPLNLLGGVIIGVGAASVILSTVALLMESPVEKFANEHSRLLRDADTRNMSSKSFDDLLQLKVRDDRRGRKFARWVTFGAGALFTTLGGVVAIGAKSVAQDSFEEGYFRNSGIVIGVLGVGLMGGSFFIEDSGVGFHEMLSATFKQKPSTFE